MKELEKIMGEELELPAPKLGRNARFKGRIRGVVKVPGRDAVAVTLEGRTGRIEVVEITPAGVRKEMRRAASGG